MLCPAAWLHNIDPFAIQVTETFGLRWYGLSYITAFVCGYIFTRIIVKRGRSTLSPQQVFDFIVTAAIGVVAGGRLGYVLFYKPRLLWTFSSDFPWWGVFELGGGGMSSHGGMLGVALVVWWYARRARPTLTLDDKQRVADHAPCAKCGYDLNTLHVSAKCPECGAPVREGRGQGRHSFLHLMDFAALTAAIGFFFGRIANFINAELIGRVCPPDYPLAVKFPQQMHAWVGDLAAGDAESQQAAVDNLHALDAAVNELGVSAADWAAAVNSGDQAFLQQTIGELVNAIQDGGPRADAIANVVEPMLTPHYPSQLYAAVLEGLLVFIVLAIMWYRPRKAGIIAGWYAILYGVMRIINERWRAPDAHIADQEFAAMGVTRGQLLSAVLVVAGIALTIWVARRGGEKLGGWGRLRT